MLNDAILTARYNWCNIKLVTRLTAVQDNRDAARSAAAAGDVASTMQLGTQMLRTNDPRRLVRVRRGVERRVIGGRSAVGCNPEGQKSRRPVAVHEATNQALGGRRSAKPVLDPYKSITLFDASGRCASYAAVGEGLCPPTLRGWNHRICRVLLGPPVRRCC